MTLKTLAAYTVVCDRWRQSSSGFAVSTVTVTPFALFLDLVLNGR